MAHALRATAASVKLSAAHLLSMLAVAGVVVALLLFA